ncbi:MAG: amino acid adenylation domain-containing protein [Bacteroidales bacterium]|nr:amino acid adenylation domain-containing protein [Bacteroidales bacterium]
MLKNLTEYFERTVQLYPHRIAVIDGEQQVTFHQLNSRVKLLAISLTESIKSECNRPVGVFLPKSIESVVVDLAITYSANIYMNLDIKSPDSRIRNVLELVKPALLITNTDHLAKLSVIYKDCPILNVDDHYNRSSLNEEYLFDRIERLTDTDPLCIINTSGSTGTPKGVVLNHKSFIDFTEWAIETLKIGDEEVIGSLSPLVFDIFSFELCMLMSKGSTIVLIQDTLSAFPAAILKLMQERQVSFIFWVPTIMVNVANMDLLSKFSLLDLKTVWFAGEVFPTKQFNYWKRHLQSAMFVNLYGPIEITLDCTYFIVDRELKDEEPIPIGFPCRNTDILILNDHNEPAVANEEGELCVRGTSLAMGYYNNPDKTAAAFVQNPLNRAYPEIIYRTGDLVYRNDRSEIIFKGRKDTLIKHLGYRIELGEIEHVIINTLKLVENGCVVYNFSKKEIILYYEAQNEIPVAEIRKAISTAFPKYMIPNNYIRMKELPRNTNGKIDRLTLNTLANQDV